VGSMETSTVDSLAVNIISVCYTTLTVAFLLLPPARPVIAANMSYTGVVLGFVLVGSTVAWITSGRKHYKGPFVNTDCVPMAG
jgi:hypothetical protein